MERGCSNDTHACDSTLFSLFPTTTWGSCIFFCTNALKAPLLRRLLYLCTALRTTETLHNVMFSLSSMKGFCFVWWVGVFSCFSLCFLFSLVMNEDYGLSLTISHEWRSWLVIVMCKRKREGDAGPGCTQITIQLTPAERSLIFLDHLVLRT